MVEFSRLPSEYRATQLPGQDFLSNENMVQELGQIQKQGGHFLEAQSCSEKLKGISSVVSTGTLLLPNGHE